MKKKLWTPTFILCSALTLIPMFAFAGIILLQFVNGAVAVDDIGLKILLSSDIPPLVLPQYLGLLPALLGTVIVALFTLFFAFPIALCMAIFASEFSLGGIGKVMEVVLSFLSGIPPIIYGLMSITLYTSLLVYKIGGKGLSIADRETVPGFNPAQPVYALDITKSLLLGGIVIGLFVIPYIAPMILDAIRSVPASLHEASFGLGAARWYTLWRITIPVAMPGIVSSVTLGVLRSIGDVVISYWSIGAIKNGMMNPMIDVFELGGTLGTTGVSMLNGFRAAVSQANSVISGTGSVAYFAASLLLVIAFIIQFLGYLVETWMQRRLTR